jgi:lipopolysaccharide assembly outer membrane protein LptD (OstA)
LLGIFFASPRFIDAQDAAAKSPPQNPSKKQSSVAKTSPQAEANGDQAATLEADQQSEVGRISHADGDVDLRYQNTRLRADHLEYNNDTQVAIARGHVQLDYMNQHVEAEEAHYELRTGHGTFFHVRATFAIDRHPAPTLLISPNPLYFEAEEAERLDDGL